MVFLNGTSRNGGHVGIFDGNIGTGGFLLALLHLKDELRNFMRLPPPQRNGKTDINSVSVIKDVTVVREVVKQILFRHTIEICVRILKLSHPCLLDNGEDKYADRAVGGGHQEVSGPLGFEDSFASAVLANIWLA